MSKELLNPEKALIFRIIHRGNLEDVLINGCLCRSSAASAYVEIGNEELIERRTSRIVPCGPGGTLSDYVPFYFTPYSPMLYNIKTGFNGVAKCSLSDILILVTSLHTLQKRGVSFVLSDRHAYLKTALFSADLTGLDRIIWPTLQDRNFRKDDVERFEKYQAEALVYKHVPLDVLKGIVCYDQQVKASVLAEVTAKNIRVDVVAQREWYL